MRLRLFDPSPIGALAQSTTGHLLSFLFLHGKDPFLGGGTVIVEALRAGRLGIGSDISLLALFVARGRTWTASDMELEELCEVRVLPCWAVSTSVLRVHL